MNMPQDTSTSPHDPSTPAIARLVDTAGRDGSATPRDVASQLQSGAFFWLDLENPGDDELAESCHSLQLSAGVIDSVTHASQRSSFALAAGSVQAVLPAAVGIGPAAWLEADYVTLLLTGQFLLTVHATARQLLREIDNILSHRPALGALIGEIDDFRRTLASSATIGADGRLPLTPAELRLLPYLQTHLTADKIAERLFLSGHTIRSEVKSIYRKLGVSSRNDAVQRATAIGLLGD